MDLRDLGDKFSGAVDWAKDNPVKTILGLITGFFLGRAAWNATIGKLFSGPNDSNEKGGLMSTWKGKAAGAALALSVLAAGFAVIKGDAPELDNVMDLASNFDGLEMPDVDLHDLGLG